MVLGMLVMEMCKKVGGRCTMKAPSRQTSQVVPALAVSMGRKREKAELNCIVAWDPV